jgi:histone acetyltransferase
MKGKPIANSTYIVRNSGRDEELVELLEFRNIIVEQLYLMSQTIVTKTLYDGVHQSFVLKDDQDENVIGGICFYEIPQHKCVSIVYFAVASQYQMQGYGNYLMTKFKSNINVIQLQWQRKSTKQ